MLCEVGIYGGLLVVWAGEVIGETAVKVVSTLSKLGRNMV